MTGRAPAGQWIYAKQRHARRDLQLISKTARFSPERPAGRAAARGGLGPTSAPSTQAKARPPQPRESGLARHPIAGPGAEDGRRRLEPLRCLHTCSSSAQTKDCKRCKRNSDLGPWSKRTDLTATSTDPCPHGGNARPETPSVLLHFLLQTRKKGSRHCREPLLSLIGATGFEPAT